MKMSTKRHEEFIQKNWDKLTEEEIRILKVIGVEKDGC